jgi:nitrite reductase/ring-hydroxylating ferredoxin subunit
MLEVIHEEHSYLIAKVNEEYFVVDNMCSHENSELILGCLKDKTS